jgi:hypothetical protein
MSRRFRKISLIECENGEWIIQEEKNWDIPMLHSIWPETKKRTAKEAAARVLQLLELGPTAPQSWPEKITLDGDDV